MKKPRPKRSPLKHHLCIRKIVKITITSDPQCSSQNNLSNSSMQVIAFSFFKTEGSTPGACFRYLRSAKAAALYVAWYISLNSSSSEVLPGAGVSARKTSGAGAVPDRSSSSSAPAPPGGLPIDAERIFARWNPYSLIQVKTVRVMRVLFSAITVSGSLAGEPGVDTGFSSETERDDGPWPCDICAPRRGPESKNGFGVGARFCGSAFRAGVVRPRTLPGRCRPAPIETDRDRWETIRSRDGRVGPSSSGSRLMRSVCRFCDDERGREGAISCETASPPRWRTRRWCCATTSKSVATLLRLGLGELMSGRNSAQRGLAMGWSGLEGGGEG